MLSTRRPKLKTLKEDYTYFLNQKAKIDWLKHGDDNTTLFFNSVKQRRLNNRINLIVMDGKSISDPVQISDAFLTFYSDLLCSQMKERRNINVQVIKTGPTLSHELGSLLDLSCSAEDGSLEYP